MLVDCEDAADELGALICAARPLAEARRGARAAARLEPVGDRVQQLGALLERLERHPQGGLDRRALALEQGILVERVADAAAVAHDLAFAQLPQWTVALWARHTDGRPRGRPPQLLKRREGINGAHGHLL